MSDIDFIESEMDSIEKELAKLEMARHHLNEAVSFLNSTYFLDMGANVDHLDDVINRLEDYIEEREITLEELDDRRMVGELSLVETYIAEIEKQVSFYSNSPASKQRICMEMIVDKILSTIEDKNIDPNHVKAYFKDDHPF